MGPEPEKMEIGPTTLVIEKYRTAHYINSKVFDDYENGSIVFENVDGDALKIDLDFRPAGDTGLYVNFDLKEGGTD